MKLSGAVAGVDGLDWVTFIRGTEAYSGPGDNALPDLGPNWNAAEFNVFGNGNGSQVVFNPGSTLVVRVVVDSGTLSPPQCVPTSVVGSVGGAFQIGGLSLESNNLTLTGLQTMPTNAPIAGLTRTYIVRTQGSSQQNTVNQGPWAKGPGPALVFAESNDPRTLDTDLNKGIPCTNVVTVGGTN